jgi:glycosyltransferase involved in cell wall biosynthesis
MKDAPWICGHTDAMRITCVHQGYELYGSDRCFVESVLAIRAACPDADIEVVLPRSGPIVAPLAGAASRIVFEPIWVLRRRDLKRLATIGMLRLPLAIGRAARRFAARDLVYINTTVIADHILAARLFPGRCLLHVHEIPEGTTRTVLRALVRWSGASIIFNSRATQAAFALPPRSDAHVVYNGIAGPDRPEPVTYDGKRKLRVLMLGRISRIKGQEVLLDALALLPVAEQERIELRIVGSAFEDAAREQALDARVRDIRPAGAVSREPFTADTAPLYRWADIVVVPSRLPESLGRVAIEAMSYGRPTIASSIGGLAEVVEDGRTGWLVPPDRADALAATLRHVITEPAAWAGFAAAARARYEALFSAGAAAAAIGSLVESKRPAPGRSGVPARAPLMQAPGHAPAHAVGQTVGDGG